MTIPLKRYGTSQTPLRVPMSLRVEPALAEAVARHIKQASIERGTHVTINEVACALMAAGLKALEEGQRQ